ncbi:unnamed protein product [Ostreobium quekettii]|uniref:N-acetyltransferase domain-containing protein n=1 Tax=Ostreobium quekettii TaxID=121088 RepID=A0A8S1JB24_9CHLO|nr:unnamed protein product [Ostreobium quekettii]|eukprot:evm.model.scf_2262.1 EVM.evm.TU.scf_2262.1   scf_2262:17607-18966(+)
MPPAFALGGPPRALPIPILAPAHMRALANGPVHGRRSPPVSAALAQWATGRGVEYSVRPAQGHEVWPAADLHCSAFYPRGVPDFLVGPLLRLDRVISIIAGQQYEASGRGRFACLVAAEEGGGWEAEGDAAAGSEGGWGKSVLGAAFPEGVRQGLGVPHERQGVLGVAVVDTLGQHLPSVPRVVDGRTTWQKMQGVAYISNLAVSPAARRQGVGKALVVAAEAAAREWGCHIAALHCDPANEGASGLYAGFGYSHPDGVEGCEEFVGSGLKRTCQLLVRPLG